MTISNLHFCLRNSKPCELDDLQMFIRVLRDFFCVVISKYLEERIQMPANLEKWNSDVRMSCSERDGASFVSV